MVIPRYVADRLHPARKCTTVYDGSLCLLMIPPARDRFVGREEDLHLIHTRLRSDRQVTVVGPPGIGKTRTAIELAARRGEHYEHVCFVPLESARSLGSAIATVGAVLELDLPPRPEADLPEAIATELARFGATLLILDNFEQLVDSASILVDRILDLAPNVHILVTSRARLRLSGEWVCELRGFSADTEESDALTLLTDRIRRLRRDYSPTEVERAQLRDIATRLEGVPLALEVAAVRISALGAANVASRLDEPLQDNLRRAVARSWDLLTEAERHVLAGCSIFRGGFELEAVSEVLAPAPRLLEDLLELCEKSLLSTVPRDDGGQRFHLYESIREFAAEQLPEERRRELARRHAHWYAALGERLQAEAEGRDAQETLDAITREHGNLLAAAGRGIAERDGVSPELGMRALLAVTPLALARGPIAPFVDKLDQVLEGASTLDPRVRIAAHLAAGRGHRRLGTTEASQRHQTEAIALASQLQDDGLIARVTSDAAMTLLSEGELEGALAMLQESAAIRERVHDVSGAALDRLRMGMALRELGRIDQAEAMLDRAMETFRRDGNTFRAGLTYAELVHIALDRGQYEEAHRILERARKAGAQSASRLTDAALTARAGMLAQSEGDLPTAETALSAAMIGLRRIGYRRFEAGVIGYLGIIDFELGRLEAARERMLAARDMMSTEPRVVDLLSGWLCAIEVVRGDRAAASRAAERIGPFRPEDPLSVAARVLSAALTKAPPELEESHLSHDVRLAFRVGLEMTGARVQGVQREEALCVSASGRWFLLPGGARGECNRYRALRLILLELVKQRLLRPEQPVPRDALIAAGWPGERIQPEAARNRLKVAISTLRRSGLEDLLGHKDGGYLLDPAVPVVVVGDE